MDSFLALAGIIAPYMTGFLVEKTGSFNSPFMLLIGFTLTGVLAVALMQNPDRDRQLKAG
jgi:cyanate permease